jgi:hypothetical protein
MGLSIDLATDAGPEDPKQRLLRRLVPRFRIRTVLVIVALIALSIGGDRAWKWGQRLGLLAEQLEILSQASHEIANNADRFALEQLRSAEDMKRYPPDIGQDRLEAIRQISGAKAAEELEGVRRSWLDMAVEAEATAARWRERARTFERLAAFEKQLAHRLRRGVYLPWSVSSSELRSALAEKDRLEAEALTFR